MTGFSPFRRHGPDVGGGHLVRALPGEEHGPPRRVGQRDPQRGPGGPPDRAPEGLELDLRALGERKRDHPGTHAAALEDDPIPWLQEVPKPGIHVHRGDRVVRLPAGLGRQLPSAAPSIRSSS